MDIKRKTKGIDPKIWGNVVTILSFLLSYFGVDLPAEVSAAIAVVLGFLASYFSPPARVMAVSNREER